ncbi:hypothetical protein CAAN1_02S09054 [[Candida] anglica]|uniref:Uncharacterized protein n=1 Tax=[Candida] anglica TaxID=148631 RepID=A0ABP0EEG1_9ASCO
MTRRSRELKIDMERFEELQKREKELEADIPPNRSQRSSSSPIVKVEGEEERIHIVPRVREPKSAVNAKFRATNRFFNNMKPKYLYTKDAKRSEPVFEKPVTKKVKDKVTKNTKKKNSKTASATTTKPTFTAKPPLVTDKKNVRSFESHTVLSNTYSDLIGKVRSEINEMDIPLHHQFVPKNLVYEKQRFDINEETDMFSSFDIDLFFQRFDQEGSNARKVPLV